MALHPFYFSLIAFGMTIVLSLLVASLVKFVLVLIQRSQKSFNRLSNGKPKADNQ